MTLLTLALASCLSPNFVNESSHKQNKTDLENLIVAKKGCKKHYQACLKTFIKKDVNRYWAICSKDWIKK